MKSLTARLAAMFAAVALLVFTAVGAYLYHALANQLEAHDDADLLGRLQQVRHLLQETASSAAIADDPHRFRDAIAGHAGLVLVISSLDGRILLDTRGSDAPLPALPLAADGPAQRDAIRAWLQPDGAPARAVAALGTLSHGSQVRLLVARSDSDRIALLADYRLNVAAAVVCGALLAGLLGLALVRHALRPLPLIARQAASITAQRLSTRLDASTAPAELRAMVESFNAVLDRLHDSFERLSQFAADLAHDMRTPINNLMVQTQVALSQPRGVDDYQQLLASNVEEYERLARMVENMLFLARADHDQVRVERVQLDARAELQRIADYFEGVADEAGVQLQVQASASVLADPLLFRRAVNNLVANAIAHTPAGGAITLSAAADGAAAVICVSNPGPGIAAHDLARLFDRFYRADRARAGSTASSGLGLAIVKSIMQLHGGSADADSAPGQATAFRLRFPLA